MEFILFIYLLIYLLICLFIYLFIYLSIIYHFIYSWRLSNKQTKMLQLQILKMKLTLTKNVAMQSLRLIDCNFRDRTLSK